MRVRQFLRKYQNYTILKQRALLFAQNLQSTQDFIRQELERLEQELVRYDNLCYAELNYSKFQLLHPEMQHRLLISILQNISGSQTRPRLEKLRTLLQSLQNVSCETLQRQTAKTFGGCLLIHKSGKLYIMRELKSMRSGSSSEPRMLGFSCYDNRFRVLSEDIEIQPLGYEDYLWLKSRIDLPKQISSYIYQTLPAILNKKRNIVAVYGVYGNWKDYLHKIDSR